MREQVLTTSDLRIRRDGRTLVSGVDLTCAAGERVALVGAAGSGKSLSGTRDPVVAARRSTSLAPTPS